ncbi:MAG: hypothetical protein Q9O62_06955 [Ardenticatenia bacterium]|nr:hypothetical protein [Ardenticatenia bacterium]
MKRLRRGAGPRTPVVNNTFYNNTSNDWGAELYINTAYPRHPDREQRSIYAGDAGWLIRACTVMADNVVDYNLFYTTSTTPLAVAKPRTSPPIGSVTRA